MENKIPKPFSENIVFLDTEFTSLDPYKGEILSIGLVKMNGEELYIELESNGEVSDWVKEHVLQFLSGNKVSRKTAIEKINGFVGPNKPYMISNVNQFDAIYLYKLMGTGNTPFHWLPIDFASILFANNIDPENLTNNDLCVKLGVDSSSYRSHHALDDAKLLREVYLKLIK